MAIPTVANSTAASKTDDPTTTTRRRLLGALAIVPAVALPALPAFASAAVPSDAEFDRLLAAYRDASRASDEFYYKVMEPLEMAYFKACDQIPHREALYKGAVGEAHTLTTASKGDFALAKMHLRSKDRDAFDAEFTAACQALMDGHAWRKQEDQRLADQSGYTAASDRNNALAEARETAAFAVIFYPVRSFPHLGEKVAVMVAECGFEMKGAQETLAADVRRLQSREA